MWYSIFSSAIRVFLAFKRTYQNILSAGNGTDLPHTLIEADLFRSLFKVLYELFVFASDHEFSSLPEQRSQIPLVRCSFFLRCVSLLFSQEGLETSGLFLFSYFIFVVV